MFVAVPSQPDTLQQQLGLLDGEETLLGSFLRAVSHDLRSPLLTLSLSMELLSDARPLAERSAAREWITHGLQDMERMLGAVSDISRARRGALSSEPMPLAQVLDGDRLLDDPELAGALLAIDARAAGEALRALGAPDVRVELQPGFAVVQAALPETHAAVEGSCVAALLAGLHEYAGTPVAALAAAEVVLARQGGMLRCEDAQVQLWLPLLTGSPA